MSTFLFVLAGISLLENHVTFEVDYKTPPPQFYGLKKVGELFGVCCTDKRASSRFKHVLPGPIHRQIRRCGHEGINTMAWPWGCEFAVVLLLFILFGTVS